MSKPPASENTPATSMSRVKSAPVEWPLRFNTHSFGIFTYDTYGCSVWYANHQQIQDDENELQRSSASYGPEYQEAWGGVHGMIRNFPDPAEIAWRSKDGQAHEARIDIGEIFKDRLIRHNVPREELPDGLVQEIIDGPSILVEVNDRTIRVYMSAFVPTKHKQIPGNKRSNFRDDLILVKTYTY